MQPQQIIFAVFTALLCQGNIGSALPRGQYNTGSERLKGRSETRDVIEARDVKLVPEGEISTASHAAINERGLDLGTKLGVVGVALSAAGLVIATPPGQKAQTWFFAKAKNTGRRIAISTDAAVTQLMNNFRRQLPPGTTADDVRTDIENQGGIVAVQEDSSSTSSWGGGSARNYDPSTVIPNPGLVEMPQK